jgi:hypothetical protein
MSSEIALRARKVVPISSLDPAMVSSACRAKKWLSAET